MMISTHAVHADVAGRTECSVYGLFQKNFYRKRGERTNSLCNALFDPLPNKS